jgi:hypothetical protein
VRVASASFGVEMRKCEVDGCTGQHRARGFCILHYNNWVRYQSGVGKFEAKFRAAERERIVGLIEGLFAKSVVPGYQTAVADAVALIKVGKDE